MRDMKRGRGPVDHVRFESELSELEEWEPHNADMPGAGTNGQRRLLISSTRTLGVGRNSGIRGYSHAYHHSHLDRSSWRSSDCL